LHLQFCICNFAFAISFAPLATLLQRTLLYQCSISNATLIKTRLKRLPVISREHFRNVSTNYFYKHLLGISNTNLQNGILKYYRLKKGDWYFKYQLVLRVPIGTSTTNWYFEC
jgi:hypothetical protein